GGGGAVGGGRVGGGGGGGVVVVDGGMEAHAELRAGKVPLQDSEDRLCGDREQGVVAAVDHDRVEVLVVDELLVRTEAERLLRDRLAQALELVVPAPLGGDARR